MNINGALRNNRNIAEQERRKKRTGVNTVKSEMREGGVFLKKVKKNKLIQKGFSYGQTNAVTGGSAGGRLLNRDWDPVTIC